MGSEPFDDFTVYTVLDDREDIERVSTYILSNDPGYQGRTHVILARYALQLLESPAVTPVRAGELIDWLLTYNTMHDHAGVPMFVHGLGMIAKKRPELFSEPHMSRLIIAAATCDAVAPRRFSGTSMIR